KPVLNANAHATYVLLRWFKLIPSPLWLNFARKSVSESGLSLRECAGRRGSRRLGGEIAAFGEGADAVGGAEGERFDGHGGLAAAGGNEAAAVAEEEIFYVMRLMIGIDDGG